MRRELVASTPRLFLLCTAVAADHLVDGINEGIQAAVGMGPSFGQLSNAPRSVSSL
jgi:hypothetical protein